MELYDKGIVIGEQLVEELGTADSKKNLFFIYYNAVRLYDDLGGRENLDRAWELCCKGFVIGEQLAKELDVADRERTLSDIYNSFIEIYEKLYNMKNPGRIQEPYNKAPEIIEQLAKVSDTEDSKIDSDEESVWGSIGWGAVIIFSLWIFMKFLGK